MIDSATKRPNKGVVKKVQQKQDKIIDLLGKLRQDNQTIRQELDNLRSEFADFKSERAGVAMWIDVPNIVRRCQEKDADFDLDAVTDRIRERFGKIVLIKAFVHVSTPPHIVQQFNRDNSDVVLSPSCKGDWETGHDPVDHNMILKIMQYMDFADTHIIATEDRDFNKVVSTLKSIGGKKVYNLVIPKGRRKVEIDLGRGEKIHIPLPKAKQCGKR